MKRASISFNRTRHILVNHELEEIHTGTFDKLRDLAGGPVCELASVLTKSCIMLLPELGNAHDRHADLGILEADLGAPSFLRLGTDQHLALVDDIPIIGSLVLLAEVLALGHDTAGEVLVLACGVDARTRVHERPYSHKVAITGDFIANVWKQKRSSFHSGHDGRYLGGTESLGLPQLLLRHL